MSSSRVLLVTDLDKTLLDDDAQVPPACLDTIAAFVAAGGIFTVATGRPTRGALLYPALMDLVSVPIITYNGACIYDVRKRRAVLRRYLPEGMSALIREALARFPGVGALVFRGEDDATSALRENAHTLEISWNREHYHAPLCAVDELPTPWNKLVLAGPAGDMAPCRAFFQERCPGARIILSEGLFLEITAGGTGKCTALQTLAGSLGIPQARVIAIGDSLNDLDMLQWAGTGVAVANAEEAVRAKISNQVAGNLEHGVCECITRFALPMLRGAEC